MFGVGLCRVFALQTHFDLLDIVRTDLSQLGFPREAYKALHDHENKLKRQHSADPRWFNAAANYLSVTKQALQCKLEACSYMMRQEEFGSLQIRAAKLLLDPSDAMALGHGITVVMKKGLQERYADELESVSTSLHLHELSLDLKGAGLEGIYCILCSLCNMSNLVVTLAQVKCPMCWCASVRRLLFSICLAMRLSFRKMGDRICKRSLRTCAT
jgi:hypothetical protein